MIRGREYVCRGHFSYLPKAMGTALWETWREYRLGGRQAPTWEYIQLTRVAVDWLWAVEKANEVMRDTGLWMEQANPMLHGDSPSERIQEGDLTSVLGLIAALAEGVTA